jgi:hypothetical protein
LPTAGVVTTEGDLISEMAARGIDRRRRPSMNYLPATNALHTYDVPRDCDGADRAGGDRVILGVAAQTLLAYGHARSRPWPA